MVTNILILVPSKWQNDKRGEYFEDIVASLFIQMQFKVTKRIRVTGMEIDILAENIHTKEKAYIECKFTKGNFEAAIITKLIGNAISEDDINIAYLVTTSEPSSDAKGLLIKIEQKGNLIRDVIRFAYIGPDQLIKLFLEIHRFNKLEERLATINPKIIQEISSATLVITPEENCWVLEKQKGGIPEKAFVIPVEGESNFLKDFEVFKGLLEENKIWTGLQIINGFSSSSEYSKHIETRDEEITQIPTAERFDDYGPARPQDFVGRNELQTDIIKFFDNVLKSKTNKRVIALTGPSGFGKSSVILKLSDKLRNIRYRNKLYLFHIDSRSAGSPLFVLEAIRIAFINAIKDDFISNDDFNVSIDSIEEPLSSNTIKKSIEYLKKNNRILIIFFDQFEELLTKETLFDTFNILKKVAFSVESLQSNVILGFSWRTGLTFPEDHPAYYLWHSLKDKRVEFKIGPFSNKESSEMIGTLEKTISNKLESPLRRNLLEQAQGIPWLLKKFCIHVYRQLKEGISQRSLVGSKLNAKILFEEDTHDLSNIQLKCLKYIAAKSPVDLVEIQESFVPEIIDYLYQHRLIIKTGYKYSVYWDIFREYLITGEVPHIPMTYFPQAQLSTSLKVLNYINKEGPVSFDKMEDYLPYTIKTLFNIISDLSNFSLIKRNINYEFEVIDELINGSRFYDSIATYVAEQFERHTVLKVFYENVQPNGGINQSELAGLVSDMYLSTSPISILTYIKRIVPWLEFTGLAEVEHPNRLIRPTGPGKQKGKIILGDRHFPEGKSLFMCSASPKRAIELAANIFLKQKISRKEINDHHNRNTAQDLISLELAIWKDNWLYPYGELIEVGTEKNINIQDHCFSIIKRACLRSKFIISLKHQLDISRSKIDESIMKSISQEFSRTWRPASEKRYFNAGRRWLRFFNEYPAASKQPKLYA